MAVLPTRNVGGLMCQAGCGSYRDDQLQAFALRSSASQAFQAATRSCFSMRVFGPKPVPSSVGLPTTAVHAEWQTVDAPGQTDNRMNKMRRQQARDFHVPDFTPPSSHKLNPLLEEANRAAQEWALHHFGSIINPEQLQKIFQANIHHLAGGVYSTATISTLEWVFEYFILLYVWDDEVLYRQLDTSRKGLVQLYLEIQLIMMSTFPQDKALQETLEEYLIDDPNRGTTEVFIEKVLARAVRHPGTVYGEENVSPICSAFRNLWTRTISVMPDEWSLRFARVVQRDMLATFLEAKNLCQSIIPSVSAYIPRRRETGFAESAMVVADFVADVFLPDKIYYSPSMQRLLQATIDAVCWHNDIWSFPKELVDGEGYNLVLLISKERECSYNKAAEIVNQMVVDRCQDIQLAAAELREYPQIYKLSASKTDAIEQYIACCDAWISSTHAFHSNSSRFQIM